MTRASVLGSTSHERTIGVSVGSWLNALEQVGYLPRLQVAGWEKGVVVSREWEPGFLPEPAAEIVQSLREMERPLAGVDASQVGRDLTGMAVLVGDEFFDEFLGRPIGERIGDLQVVAVGRKQRGFEDLIKTGGEDEWVLGAGAGGLVEDAADGIADGLGRAEGRQFATALAEEAGVAGGFPRVLAEEIFQLGLADPIDERGDGAEELALDFEKQAEQARHFADGGHAAGGGTGGSGGSGGAHVEDRGGVRAEAEISDLHLSSFA